MSNRAKSKELNQKNLLKSVFCLHFRLSLLRTGALFAAATTESRVVSVVCLSRAEFTGCVGVGSACVGVVSMCEWSVIVSVSSSVVLSV